MIRSAAGRTEGSGLPRPKGADEDLLRAIYEQHGRAVLAYATRLTGDPAAAQDVLQETLIRAWRHPETLVGDRPIRPWLLTVASRIVIDRARRANARPQEVEQAPAQLLAVADPSDQLVESMRLYEAVRTLSQRHQEVVVEVYFRGHQVTEAATTLGIPEGTVKSRLFHALRLLKAQLRAQTDINTESAEQASDQPREARA